MNRIQMTGYSKCTAILILLLIDLTYQGHVSHNIPLLLYSTTKDIRLLNFTKSYNSKIKPTILVRNINSTTNSYIAAIDYHYEQQKIFWADHELENIQSITYNGVETENKTVIIGGVFTPDGLACDWFTNKIYWTDSDSNHIEVATTEGKYRKVLFWTEIDQPRAIALVPMKGFMFWTDWGESPKIERAGMNGDPKTRKIIVSDTDTIFWPNGLTIDYTAELVYWVDGKLKFIKKMDYDGKMLSTVLGTGFEYPFALTKFETKLFWTDWKTMSIQYFDTNSSTKPMELLHSHGDMHPMDIRVWLKERQPKSAHPCENRNGGCSHLCLLSPDDPGYTCACPIGIKLLDNHTCADGPHNLLLLARRADICLIYLDSPEYSYKVLPLLDVKYSIAVDFDPVDEFIYWSDDDVKKIQRARLDGSEQQDVISTEIQDPDGIAIDWISRNIYWTDTGTDRIEVARLDIGKYRRVIIMDGLVDPRGIAVAPELGWLFWSDWYEKNPKVERANLDGSERLLIVGDKLGWPNGITLDLNSSKIYWCDAKLDKIEFANMDGSDRGELISDDVPHVFGFSLIGDYLYWTDWQRRAIDRVHKDSGLGRSVIVDQMENMMGLKAIKLGPVSGWNPCKDNNGNCSQLCFYRNNKTRVCACEIDYELMRDRMNCVKPSAFLLYTKKDSIARISIENENNESTTIPIPGIKQANSIDYDINTKRVYWSDSKLRTIMRAHINGSDPQRVIDLGLVAPEGIAVDWLGKNIYWTDPVAHRIEVATLNGDSRRTLLWGDINEPHSIVLDPVEGYMYWSEWGGNSNAIKKATMDGRNATRFIATTGKATGLTLDYKHRRIYWTEIDTQPAILSSDLNANDRQIIVKNVAFKPIALTLHGDYIYWSDNKTFSIGRARKLDGADYTSVYSWRDSATDLLVYHAHKQSEINSCSFANGGCKHLCLALPADYSGGPQKFTCACPTHYTLIDNECIAPTNFMIYSQKNLAVRLVLDTADCPEAVLPIQGLKSVKAIDFDPKNNFLYWIDGKSSSIKRSEASGSQFNVVVPSNSELKPFDLAVDVIGRLLFWTCASQNVINVTRLDNIITFGSLKKIEGEQPRLLAIHLTKRLLFYTDDGQTPQLVRARLDGSHRIIIAKGERISAIAVDSENDNIVWTQKHNIYISNIDGENQHVLLNESVSETPIEQLTIHSGWLYWIDHEIHQLQRLELSGKSRLTVSIQASHILDLISVKLTTPHSCHLSHQKRCSHFCILNGTEPLCACPYGKMLQDDKRSCITLPNCGEDRFTCIIRADPETKDCIPLAWRCDKQKDCSDGSDELDCPSCAANQFLCHEGGKCIDSSRLCDGVADCPDGADEKRCCTSGFQCPQTEVCLSHSVVCDGNENCADGSDEAPSLCAAQTVNKPNSTVILVVLGVLFVIAMIAIVFYSQRRKFLSSEDVTDQSEDSLSPMHPSAQNKSHKLRKGIPDVVRMSMMNDTYDRRHITGASSSSNTNGSSVACYPRETLNPPPSPATTAASTRGSSPSSRYRPYRHYRTINQPPPPTPCSTDVADESDYNYPTTRNRYDGGPFPPPPTPRSHCHNESCPPSPSSRSSTYFSPLPPPPSPVASPRGGYDS